MPRSGLEVAVGGGGVESKFSVQLRPKLNNRQGKKNTYHINVQTGWRQSAAHMEELLMIQITLT